MDDLVDLNIPRKLYSELCAFADAHGIGEGASLLEFMLRKAQEVSAQSGLPSTAARHKRMKIKVLEERGYRYSFGRHCYLNEEQRKGFSEQFIEQKSVVEILSCLHHQADTPGWQFFFLEPPTRSVQAQLETLLGDRSA